MARRVDGALKACGVAPNSKGSVFNKGHVAKLLLAELSERSLVDLPIEMVERFEWLFKCINESMPWFEDVPVSGKAK